MPSGKTTKAVRQSKPEMSQIPPKSSCGNKVREGEGERERGREGEGLHTLPIKNVHLHEFQDLT